MRTSSFLVAAAAFLGMGLAQTDIIDNRQGLREKPAARLEDMGSGTFDQLLEHSDPSKGTFKQRIWWNDTWYKGPGSPIFLFNPGETNAVNYTGYLNENALPGRYARQFGGAAILIERECSCSCRW